MRLKNPLATLGAAFLLLAALAVPARAQNRAAVEEAFRAWIEGTVWPAAVARGVSRETFDEALDGVAPDWDLPDLLPPGAPPADDGGQAQAEFRSPAPYFESLEGTAAAGREMATRHAEALATAEQASGVPGRILLAIWGRESAFGRADLPHDAFEVLATRGFMGRRADFFAEELLAALELAQRGGMPAEGLPSNWAGALGQPQFMPSSVLEFAADGDGDGRSDIWGSEADAIASIASFLEGHGWVPGRGWGWEVAVPPAVSCAQEGPDQGRAIAEWEAMGIARADGQAFPEAERAAEGFLVMPAGRRGPAFLVTPNFYVLKDYNTSDLYALYVGHLGDRIAGGAAGFSRGWDPAPGLTRGDVSAIQAALQSLGHDTGGTDGLAGFRTRRSVGRWQEGQGLEPTCWPDRDLLGALVP